MTNIDFKEKMASKKFIFSLFALIVVSAMLFFGKLPPSYYETITMATIITYLSSNVAYRYVNTKNGMPADEAMNTNNKEMEVYDESHHADAPQEEIKVQKGISYGG